MPAERTESELSCRQAMIEEIERRAGTLLSVPYDKILTADLAKLMIALAKVA